MEQQLDLTNIRSQIDAIDDEMTALYAKRLSLCDKVAASKKQTGKAVRDDKREQAILERLTEHLTDADTKAVKMLYSTIFETSRARQHALLAHSRENAGMLRERIARAMETPFTLPKDAVVACQGVEGAYSQIACTKLFEDPKILYFDTFEGVFKSVSSGLCQYGVLPFENSIHGSVTEVYDTLAKSDVHVVHSVKLPIHHALLCKKGVVLSEIREIYSHKQAIGQCSEFLAANRSIKVNVCENTAVAAKMVAQSDRRDIAAISSTSCAALYGLDILKRDLQNSGINFTMFYCIAKELAIPAHVNKAAFMFCIPNRSGSLLEVLSRFAINGINLTKIESRPISGKDFEFLFYAEADIPHMDAPFVSLLDELSDSLDFFKFIGAYQEHTPTLTR